MRKTFLILVWPLREKSRGLVDETVPDEGENGFKPVSPIKLLALLMRTRMVGNGHLHDGIARFPNLGRELRTELEAGAAQPDFL